GDGIKVVINRLAYLDETYEDFGESWIVADVTFTDVADGFGTVIPEDCFRLVRKDYEDTYLKGV
ncbi:MAG TPA: hypothetical protein DDZ89_12635, partial [Clostridiales bacterium]|nr:hypothetical protein [Clostridiales bacterium]